jgi:hypothetical protein
MGFMFLPRPKSRFILRGSLQSLVLLCLVLCTGGRANAGAPSAEKQPSFLPGLKSNFAIADFDGDRKPDLATVEIQTGRSGNSTHYSIRLELTAGAAQVFAVIAPAGGLQIVAQDVNGDDALDVLVSTALQHQQVALLLNDGHGKFTLADPAAFPAVLCGDGGDWNCETFELCDSSAVLRMEYPAREFEGKKEFEGLQVELGATAGYSGNRTASHPYSASLGRAPPTSVHTF